MDTTIKPKTAYMHEVTHRGASEPFLVGHNQARTQRGFIESGHTPENDLSTHLKHRRPASDVVKPEQARKRFGDHSE